MHGVHVHVVKLSGFLEQRQYTIAYLEFLVELLYNALHLLCKLTHRG